MTLSIKTLPECLFINNPRQRAVMNIYLCVCSSVLIMTDCENRGELELKWKDGRFKKSVLSICTFCFKLLQTNRTKLFFCMILDWTPSWVAVFVIWGFEVVCLISSDSKLHNPNERDTFQNCGLFFKRKETPCFSFSSYVFQTSFSKKVLRNTFRHCRQILLIMPNELINFYTPWIISQPVVFR